MTLDSSGVRSGGDEIQTITKVVLVGHCGFDQASIGRAVASAVPSAALESVFDTAGLQQHAGPDALLLVNRVLDGRFSTGSGVELIQELAASEHAPAMMLISNYPEAQAKAVDAGALQGFGKNALRSQQTAEKLQAAVLSSLAK